MRTVDNCSVIRFGTQINAGIPKNDGHNRCEGYCTEDSDEPYIICQRCRYRKEWEADESAIK